MTDTPYIGRELDLFANVHNWKRYWSAQIAPYVRGDVLEVGAGLGANTPFLHSPAAGRWVCLEPDSELAAKMNHALSSSPRESRFEIVCGTLASLEPQRRFDTLVYIDVLEHIENDREELARAAARLNPGGHLVVLSPAHQWLFTPFDKAIGHFRRYDRQTLRRAFPPEIHLHKLIYLDSAGLTASLANRFFLRQTMPQEAQLQFWDRRLIPVSRILDKVLGYGLGKSILAIGRKPAAG